MNIVDITIQAADGKIWLECVSTDPLVCHAPVNEGGLWASSDDARNPAEIAAWLRNFADSLDKHAKAKVA